MTPKAFQVIVEQLAKDKEHYDTNRLGSMRDYLYTLDMLDNMIFHEQQATQRDIEQYRENN